MAAAGAKVLHLRCVEYARRYDMPIHVRSSFSQTRRHLGRARTAQAGGRPMEQAIIAGVAHDRSEAKITVVGVPDKPGEAARIFEALADAEINIDMIVQNVSAAADRPHRHLLHAAHATDGQTAMTALARDPATRSASTSLLYDDQIGKVSLIGAGMRSHPGVSATFFAALADAGRQHRDDLDLGDPDLGGRRRGRRSTTRSRAVHTAFDLDADEVEAVVYGGTGR